MSWVVWDLLSSVWKSVDFCIIVWICVVLVYKGQIHGLEPFLVYGLGLEALKLISF